MGRTDKTTGHTLISLDKANQRARAQLRNAHTAARNEPKFAVSLTHTLSVYACHLTRRVIDTRGVDLGNKKEKQKLFACKQKQQQPLHFSRI